MNHFVKIVIFVLSIVANVSLWGQTVAGIITDNAHIPIPYASILVKETSTGTTSNVNGEFELLLPEGGSFHLSFQSLGFEKKEMVVTVRNNHTTNLNVELLPQTFKLKEIRIYSGNEDPAYAVMRKAIALAPYHQKQVNEFTSEVYIKASFIVKKIPEFIRKRTDINGQKIEAGRRYTAESINKISFTQPNKYKHTVVSSRSSFPATNGNDPMGYINASLYDAQIGEIITPLAPNALNHYKFRYEGFFDDGPLTVNKIKVTPKRKSQQLLSGYLYVIEGLWCIHSVDLTNDAFWGNIRIRQVYTPVKDGIWMPATHHFDAGVAMMGTKAEVTYAGSVKYLSVTPNTKLKVPSLVKTPVVVNDDAPPKPVTSTQKKLEAVMAKENPSNRDVATIIRLMEKEQKSLLPKDTSLQIERRYQFENNKDSIQRDSAYWNAIRPIPLTADEVIGFHKADSIKLVAMTHKTDSSALKNKSFYKQQVLPVVLGKQWKVPNKEHRYDWKGLLNPQNIGFNPVDGWRYHFVGNMYWGIDSLRSFRVVPTVGYAFDRQQVLWQTDAIFNYAPLKRARLTLLMGQSSTDYNRVNRPSGLANMAYNLLLKERYQMFFQRSFFEAYNRFDVANGTRLTLAAGYQHMAPLQNHTNFSLYRAKIPYEINLPQNDLITPKNLATQNQLAYAVSIEYTPRFYYRISNGRKIMMRSNYPTFELLWKQGVYGFLNSDAQWMQVEATIRQKRDFGLSSIDYLVNGGSFLQRNNMHFSAFKSFGTFNTGFEFKSMPYSFVLIPNYRYHTNRQYLQSHFTYSTPFLAVKLLPFFSNMQWYENLYFRNLTVQGHQSHTELGYGLSRVLLAGEASVVAAFDNVHYKSWGIRLAWHF